MAYFFRLGSNRLPCWSLFLIPLFAFGDFGVSDSATLNQIAIDVAHAANASQGADSSLVYIRSDTAYLADVVYDAQQNLDVMQGYLYRLSYTGLRSITNALWGIFDKLETDYQHHNIGNTTSSFSSIYTHDVRTDDIYSRLGDLQDSINNLTNYLCYSPEYVSSVSVNTNFPFLFIPFASAASSTQDMKNRIKTVYQNLYGVTPPQSVIDSIYALVNTYDFRRYFTSDRIQLIDESILPSQYKGTWWSVVKNVWSLVPNSTTEEDYRKNYSKAYNYLFGTRQFTDTTIGISNILVNLTNIVANITNGLYDVSSGGFFEETSDPSRSGFRIGRVVQTGVSSVMEEAFFTDTVSTNIVGNIDSNSIVKLADNTYKNNLDNLTHSTPQEFSDLDGILSEINTASGAIDDAISYLDADHSNDYTLPLTFESSRLGTLDLSLQLSNTTNYTSSIIQFFCYFIQIAIALYFFRQGWNRVVATVNFHNEPDPF